ncbi:helix-turn-helix domain-containing protein [Ruegeria atlantica]|uniref:helix-turn-helix domain-containing protein n=1 Tax=Ruegeria atlantica TaxID=81569 RepID=UPI00147AF96C|nr:helix-turn-helix transcriptional regulator [Ruegeria atlantica]
MAYTNPQQGTGEDSARLRKAAGLILKNHRLDVQKTQRQLAEEIGFEYYTMISQIEGGKTRVPPLQMEAYAKALGIDRASFAKLMLRHYDPAMYRMLFSETSPSA